MTLTVGFRKRQLETPALCVDLDKLDANIHSLADQTKQAGVAWRPHAKCHKSPIIARRLTAGGAIGVTCAKLSEAEVMANGGVTDLLIANFIVGDTKIKRLAALCHQAQPIVCVDHPDQVAPLANAMSAAGVRLRVLVELDIGMRRAGISPGRPAIDLARKVHLQPGLQLEGIMGYEGHLLTVPDLSEKRHKIRRALQLLTDAAEQLRAEALPCPIVSCGGTGSYEFSLEQPGISEIQAGGAIFMDEFYRDKCQVTRLENALTVMATVVSHPTENRAIIDAGRKTMDQQICMPRVIGHPGVVVDYLSAEHGVLRLAPEAARLQIGDRMELVPGYVDFTTVLHNQFHVFQQDRLVAIWPLEARGLLT